MPNFNCLTDLLSPGLTGWLLTIVLLPAFIWLQRRLNIGQFIRQEGPQSHAIKFKTPTLGGACLVIVSLLVSCVFTCKHRDSTDIYSIFVASGLCGLLGLIDDLSKLVSGSNAGLSAKIRLICELSVGASLGLWLISSHGVESAAMQILHNCDNHQISMAVHLPALFFIVFTAFTLAAACNALNLHDGLDGLAAGTSWQIFVCLAILLQITRQPDAAVVAASAAGSTAGFLLYNRHPAKIFMGDVGSLFLGSLMFCLAISGHLIVWFIPLALIYILETLSVIAQVVTFKLTKPYVPEKPLDPVRLMFFKLTHRLPGEGLRVLRMAPLHHHFESLCSEKHIGEAVVVAWFWVVQAVICVSVIVAFFLLSGNLPSGK